jgi:hypothetical protein
VRELVGHDPGQRIERGARRKRDDDLDQPRRVSVLSGARATTQRGEQPADQQEPWKSQHARPIYFDCIAPDDVQTEVWVTPSFASSASAAAS